MKNKLHPFSRQRKREKKEKQIWMQLMTKMWNEVGCIQDLCEQLLVNGKH